MLTVKVHELCDLNKNLKERNQVFHYEAASVQHTLDILINEDPRRYFTRAEWEVGSEA
jgi:hypothetical protein